MSTATVPPPVSLVINILDVIAAPATAFRRISAHHRRSWLLPAALALLAPLLYLWVTLPDLTAEAVRQFETQLGAMPADQVEAARPMLERFTQPGAIFTTAAVTAALGLCLAWLVSTLILYLGASIAGAVLSLPELWPVVVWTWFPLALRALLQTLWSLVNGAMIRYPGLSYWVASGDVTADQSAPLYLAASQVDLFALWHLALVYVLLRHVARLKGGGALVMTLLYAAINLGLRLVPGLVAGALTLG